MVDQPALLDLDGSARKPVGGFTFITVVQLAMVWWSYREGHIRLVDLRTWFACWELVSRRCELGRGQSPEYTLGEVHRLTGGAGERAVKSSLERLRRAGLVTCSRSAIRFASGPDSQPGSLEGFWEFLGEIENNRRRVPVPRRVVRFIAGGAGRVLTATILGHLLRCLYYRDAKCSPVGNCRASWVAGLFGVGVPNVKSARQHLVGLGLFEVVEMPQWHRNRYGARVALNLAWDGPQGGGSGGGVASGTPEPEPARRTETRPPEGRSATGSRPPCVNQELSPTSRTRNQEPASGRPAGVSEREGAGEPRLAHVVRPDLSDTARLLELWRQACRSGAAQASEHGRLRFVALAEHALAYGTRNPCGLFAWLLAHQQWGFITQADEDQANRRIKEHLFRGTASRGEEPGPVRLPSPVAAEPLSEVARLVVAVNRVVAAERLTMDPFHLARRHRATLTREEWETGVGELENWRQWQLWRAENDE